MFQRVERQRIQFALRWLAYIAPAVFVLAAYAAAIAQDEGGLPGEAAIRATADEFAKAFDRGDAKALAAMWTADGMMSDERGAVFQGRQAIEEQYTALFQARPQAKMKISVLSIQLPAPGVAIEDGVASLTSSDSEAPPASRYRAVHILDNGKWQMTSVRESPAEAAWNSPQLGKLEWLIGKWELKSGDAVAQSEFQWIANKSFIRRDYVVRSGDNVVSSGAQTIGWDPASGQLKSWSFDSSGGNGTGLWSATSDGWQIENTGVLADGTRTTSRDFLIRVPGEDNVLGWRSTQRMAGQSVLPDTSEIVLDRVLATH